jgi:hypothetical protein
MQILPHYVLLKRMLITDMYAFHLLKTVVHR